MTNEQNFKKGDRVVYNGEHLHISEEIIKDDILTVYDVSQNGDKVWVQHPAVGKVDASELKMYLPCDRRTAFLTRLQSLLREYDATIQAHRSGVDTVGLCISFGDGSIEDADYQQNDTICDIDADNIMEFDKE